MAMNIIITLPANRYQHGTLALEGADFITPCLGKAGNRKAAAHGNPERNPLLPYGDTPLGAYKGCRVTYEHRKRWPAGLIWLGKPGGGKAVAGQALKADERREGLAIHAGRGDKRLVATYGCVRVHKTPMYELAGLLKDKTFDVLIKEA